MALRVRSRPNYGAVGRASGVIIETQQSTVLVLAAFVRCRDDRQVPRAKDDDDRLPCDGISALRGVRLLSGPGFSFAKKTSGGETRCWRRQLPKHLVSRCRGVVAA